MVKVKKKSKGIPVTGRRGLQGYATTRIPHYLDSRFTGDYDVRKHTDQPHFIPQEESWYYS
jgi:hypothetical protein